MHVLMRTLRPALLVYLLCMLLIGLHTCAGKRFPGQVPLGDEEDQSPHVRLPLCTPQHVLPRKESFHRVLKFCSGYGFQHTDTCIAQVVGNSEDLGVMTPHDSSAVSAEQMGAVRKMWQMLRQVAPSHIVASGGNPSPAIIYRNFANAKVSRCQKPVECDCAPQNYTVLVPPREEIWNLARQLDLGLVDPTEVLFTLLLHIIPAQLTQKKLATSVSPGLVQTLAGVGLSGVRLRISQGSQDDVTLTYANVSASIEVADVETCHPGSVVHFVSHMLRTQNLPESYMEWIDGGGDVWENNAPSHFQRTGTIITSCLMVLCVVGLLFGVFWGRRKLNLSSERLAAERARRALQGSMRGARLGFGLKSIHERSPLVAVFEPKMLRRVGPMLWAVNPPPKLPEPSKECVADAMSAHDGDATPQVEGPSATATEPAEAFPEDEEAGTSNSKVADAASAADLACTCVICFEGPGSHVLLPCGHGGYCTSCARTLLALPLPSRLCPVCRTGLKSVADISLDTPIGGVSKVLRGFGARGMPDTTCTMDSVGSDHILPQPSAQISGESNRASQSSDRESDSLQVVVQLAAAEVPDVSRESGNAGNVIVGLSTVRRDDVSVRDDEGHVRPPATVLLNIPIQNVNVS